MPTKPDPASPPLLGGAEPAPERSLAMLLKAVETMSLGVTITDLDQRILYVNPADARMHGWEVDELLGEDARVLAGGPSAAARPAKVREFTTWEREAVNRTRDGRPFPVRLVSDLVRGEGGEPIAVVTVCENIGERKRIEAALARRDAILEAVARAAEILLVQPAWEEGLEAILDRLGRATGAHRVSACLVSPAARALDLPESVAWSAGAEDEAAGPDAAGVLEVCLTGSGGDRDEATATTLRRRLAAGDAVELAGGELAAAFGRRSPASSLLALPVFVQEEWHGALCFESTAERRWTTPERSALGAAARLLGAAIQRRQSSRALSESREHFRDLLENASDLIQSVDLEGRFELVNRAWRERLGYREEELAELTAARIVRPDLRDAYRAATAELVSGGGSTRLETVFLTASGEEIEVEGNLDCRHADGRPLAVRGIFRDIGERRQVERMKQEFVGTVSHELRTPLSSIVVALDLLDDRLQAGDRERAGELLDVATRNGRTLIRLIDDLLDLQRLDGGTLRVEIEPVAVGDVVDESLAGLRMMAESAGVELTRGAVCDGARVLADRGRLVQVLGNLLANAIKFSPSGERVVLTASRSADRVAFSVVDRGPGIPAEMRQRIFDRFVQADSSRSRRFGGSGLGLDIARGLCERMGGEVAVESETGRGSTFSVTLPAAG